MNYQKLYEALILLIKSKISGFEIRYKNESKLQELIGFLFLPFNPNYLKTVTTTLYPRVWLPSREYEQQDYKRAFEILAHEYVHLSDRHKQGRMWTLKYAFPQILVLLAFFSVFFVFTKWALLALVFLAALLPWPAPYRVIAEARGYLIGLFIDAKSMPSKDALAATISGPVYFWPCSKDRARVVLLTTPIEMGGPHDDVDALVRRSNAG